MSGHNKWSTIKRKKGATDAKRSKIFSKIVKEINVAVKTGGSGDPELNPSLRAVLLNAKGVNMPKATIEKAISKAESGNENYEEVTFEGYGPGGVALFVDCLSDNNNRTVSNIRAIFNKRNGTLGTNGSLSFIFDRKGVFTIPAEQIPDLDEVELDLIDAGAEDIEKTDDKYIVTTSFEDFGSMQKKLEELKLEAENQETPRVANNTKKVDVDTARKIMNIIDVFEEDDDVQNVYHNMELTDEILEALNEE
ncbi:MAG: YebC/PmpR family DNA-binding transcriptional regulator [Bacteroidales bacterium]|nr:YebC/PmpR family DNA-binding transcriptional regulator [Bacteroidales bacterium]